MFLLEQQMSDLFLNEIRQGCLPTFFLYSSLVLSFSAIIVISMSSFFFFADLLCPNSLLHFFNQALGTVLVHTATYFSWQLSL